MAISILLVDFDFLYKIGVVLGTVAILAAIYTSSLMIRAIVKKRAEAKQSFGNEGGVISIGYATKSFRYPQTGVDFIGVQDSLHKKRIKVRTVTLFEKDDQYDGQSTYDLCEN